MVAMHIGNPAAIPEIEAGRGLLSLPGSAHADQAQLFSNRSDSIAVLVRIYSTKQIDQTYRVSLLWSTTDDEGTAANE